MGKVKFNTLGQRRLGETKLRKKKVVTEVDVLIRRKLQAKKKIYTFPFILGSSLVTGTVNAFHCSP